MATTDVTPNLGAVSEGASAAPVSTPSAAPDTSTSQSTPSVTPSTSTPSTPTRNPGESEYAFLQRVRQEREAAAQKTEPAKAAEVKPVEVKPTETKVEDKPVETKTETTEPTEEIEPELSLADEVGPLPPQELAQKFKENPELEAALQKAGIDKNAVFAMSRLAAKATKYDEIFTDFDQAKFAAQQADTFAQADDLFTNIRAAQAQGTPAFHGAIDNFMGLLLQLDQQQDENGNPITDPRTGQPVLQGNAQAFIQGMRDLTLNSAFQEWKQMAANDEEFQAALDVLEQRVSGSADQTDIPETVKAKEAAINAEKEALNRQREADAEAKHQEFENAVLSTSKEKYVSMIDKLVGQTDLTDGFKKVATDMIINGLADSLAKDPKYRAEREALARLPYGDQAKTKRIALNERYGKALLKKVAEPVFKELGAKVLSKQQATQTKIDAQIAASKAEPKGSTASAAPAAAVNVSDAVNQFIAKTEKETGRRPAELDIIKFVRSLKAN